MSIAIELNLTDYRIPTGYNITYSSLPLLTTVYVLISTNSIPLEAIMVCNEIMRANGSCKRIPRAIINSTLIIFQAQLVTHNTTTILAAAAPLPIQYNHPPQWQTSRQH